MAPPEDKLLFELQDRIVSLEEELKLLRKTYETPRYEFARIRPGWEFDRYQKMIEDGWEVVSTPNAISPYADMRRRLESGKV